MEFALLVIILMIFGAIAGVIAGLLGVGGGLVLVPAFYYTFSSLGYGSSFLMQICVATSLATIIVTSLRSLQSHNKKGAVDWTILRLWAPYVGLGALIGVFAATQLSSRSLMGIFAGLGIIVSLYMAFGKTEGHLADKMPEGGLRATIGGAIGFFSALMGIGGGSFAVPLQSFHGRPIHKAVATASGFGLIIALPSAFGFLVSGWGLEGKPPLTFGYVNIPAFLIVVLMTLITAPIGAKLAHSMNPKPLKRIFAVFIALVALNMLRKAIGG